MRNIDIDAISHMTIEQQRQALARMAKTANQRLRRLEKIGYEKNAYAKAKKDIEAIKGDMAKPRFSERTKTLSRVELARQVQAAAKFLTSVTSTISGIKKVRKERENFIKEKIGVKEQNVDDFFEYLEVIMSGRTHEYLSSDQIMKDIDAAIESGLSKQVLESIYDDWISGKKQAERTLDALRRRTFIKK